MPAEQAPVIDAPPVPGVEAIGHHNGTMWVPGNAEGNNVITVSPDIHVEGGKFSNIGNPKIDIDVGAASSTPERLAIPVSGTPEVPGPDPSPTPEEVPPNPLEQQVAELRQEVQELRDQVRALVEALNARGTEPTPDPPEPTPDPPEPTPDPPEPTPDPPEPIPDPPEPTPTPTPEVVPDINPLERARNDLVEITIRRKGRMGDNFTFRFDRGRADKEAYASAMTEYLAAQEQTAQRILEAGTEAGKTPDEIRKEIVVALFEERRTFAQKEVDVNNQMLDEEIASSSWKRPWTKSRKLLKQWSQYSTKKKIMIGLGVGLGVGVVSGTAGLGLAGLAAGSAVKFSLGLLNRRASLRNIDQKSLERELHRINLAENAALINGLKPGAGEHELSSRLASEVARAGTDHEGRVRYAQRRNRLGNALLLASGVMVGLGAEGVHLVPDIKDLWGGGGGGGGGQNVVGGGGHNIEFVGPDRITGVNLPQGMDLVHSSNGHLAIYDSVNHREVLNGGSLPNGLFDRQGDLSAAGREFFRSRGFSLDQATRLAGRFMTTINAPKA